MNTFGERLRLTTFGESHGVAIGGVLDGYPPGVSINYRHIERRMAERRPGQKVTSARREPDKPEFLSGISQEGVSLGTPIAFIIRNEDVRSDDYEKISHAFRPNHADFTYWAKYGIRDYRGGGRASARETACRVVAGALAEQLLIAQGITVTTWLSKVGTVEAPVDNPAQYDEKLLEEVERVRREKDSIGGVVSCSIYGLPPGVGEPIYDKLSARLAYAMMSINAAKGFEIGDGFDMAMRMGSEVVDEFYINNDGCAGTRTNHNGGVLGGISTGMPVEFRVAFKPTPTIGKPLPLLSEKGEEFTDVVQGRHDPCVAVRAVPVVRAMACLVVSDLILRSRS